MHHHHHHHVTQSSHSINAIDAINAMHMQRCTMCMAYDRIVSQSKRLLLLLLLTPKASPAIWSSVQVGITSIGPARLCMAACGGNMRCMTAERDEAQSVYLPVLTA
jgi:hypothetical protein